MKSDIKRIADKITHACSDVAEDIYTQEMVDLFIRSAVERRKIVSNVTKCVICGEPMPEGEQMFKFHGFSGPCPKPPLPKQPTELEKLKNDSARYKWLISKVITRGETCLALYAEFGGAPFEGETVQEFMDRYIDDKLST